jgi:hypothetical protein
MQKILANRSAKEQNAALSLEPHIPDPTLKVMPKEAKIKVKTRSEANPPAVPGDSPSTPSSEEDQELRTPIQVSVSKSALGIFHSMFSSQ